MELDLLVIDDPSESFDTSHVSDLVGELARAAHHAQLFVATHEREKFEPLLRSHFDSELPTQIVVQGFDRTGGPNLPAPERQFDIKSPLDTLRAECGDGEFGYRMQGLFAHVLLELGAQILEVNAQGHPDIKARLTTTMLAVQVKSCNHSHAASVYQLSDSDLAGITSPQAKGYLAFLDCAVPVSWHLIEASIARQFLGRCIPIATLRAERDDQMSYDCTEIFVDLILMLKDRLSLLTFSLLAKRALRGNRI